MSRCDGLAAPELELKDIEHKGIGLMASRWKMGYITSELVAGTRASYARPGVISCQAGYGRRPSRSRSDADADISSASRLADRAPAIRTVDAPRDERPPDQGRQTS